MKIVIDGNGGDFAPQEIVKGIFEVAGNINAGIIVTGDKDILHKEFQKWGSIPKNVEIYHAPETIAMDESPSKIIDRKDSSLVAGALLVKDGVGDVLISAGNTGGSLAVGIFIIGRLKGINRPGIATLIPCKEKNTLLIDAGANVEFKPQNIIQFATMGSIYMNKIIGIKQPTVGLLNVGEEENKGNKNYQEANMLLSKCDTINYTGNIEGRELLLGKCDVVVCDGFVGNIALKVMEGTAGTIVSILKESINQHILSKIGALLMKKTLMALKKRLDFEEHGGAPLLGLNRPIIICHGSSSAKAIRNALLVGQRIVEKKLTEEFAEFL